MFAVHLRVVVRWFAAVVCTYTRCSDYCTHILVILRCLEVPDHMPKGQHHSCHCVEDGTSPVEEINMKRAWVVANICRSVSVCSADGCIDIEPLCDLGPA